MVFGQSTSAVNLYFVGSFLQQPSSSFYINKCLGRKVIIKLRHPNFSPYSLWIISIWVEILSGLFYRYLSKWLKREWWKRLANDSTQCWLFSGDMESHWGAWVWLLLLTWTEETRVDDSSRNFSRNLFFDIFNLYFKFNSSWPARKLIRNLYRFTLKCFFLAYYYLQDY